MFEHEPSTLAGDTAFAAASLEASRALPNTVLASSADCGWTSLLLERHRSEGRCDAFDTLATPDQTLVIALRGSHELESFHAGRWHKAIYRPGSGGMTAGHATSRLRWTGRDERDGFETAHLYLPRRYLVEAADHYRHAGQGGGSLPLDALVLSNPLLAHLVFDLLAAMRSGVPDLYAESAARWIAAHLLASHAGGIGPGVDDRSPGLLTDRRLARVLDFMSANLAEPLGLDRLASEAAISKFHFSRMFTERVGTTPHEYLVRLRIETARRLLLTSDLSIGEVASASGYRNVSHFGVAFGKRVGMSPTRYRRLRPSAS